MALTTKARVTRLLGEVAVQLRLDDQGSQAAAAMTDVLNYVDEMIYSYTDQVYERSDLINSEYLAGKATFLAANILSQRRGNKPLYAMEREEIMEELIAIGAGQRFISGIPVRAMPVPSVRSQSVNHNIPRNPLVVDRNLSTGGGYAGENSVGPFFN